MSQPYLGEIRMVGFNFAPVGWAHCDGSLLPISQNQALFALIGTTYGGNGQTTFALPDMRGRIPVHQGAGPLLSPRPLGQAFGSETVSLLASQMPAHGHALAAASGGVRSAAASGALLASGESDTWTRATADGLMAANALATAGGSQPHENMQPFACVNFIIALSGIFPTPA
ncbi:MAG: tail fiber protein [Pseudoxanthomonas sp.]|nr:tail fiber protein [Pseudoxanthomonas sp.]